MIRQFRGLLLLAFLAFAPGAFGRVLSYAPYTNRTAVRGHQERTTRHFVVREGNWEESGDQVDGDVVLYDSLGLEDPRVVYSDIAIYYAALFQEHADAQPVLLIGVHENVSGYFVSVTKISVDGGRTWRKIPELDGATLWGFPSEDHGGAWTQGLEAPIRIGSGDFPFIVSFFKRMDGGIRVFVYAIPQTGAPKVLASGASNVRSGWGITNVILAQDRAGTRFVVRTEPTQMRVVSLDGSSTPLGVADEYSSYSGWITPDGSVYLVRVRAEGSFLYLWRNGMSQLLAGSYDTPEPDNSYPRTWEEFSFFAVPTHDFNGAWLVQRNRQRPTTLSRHTPGGVVEKSWEDASGPEVEALHVGSSGELLLIQVHRDRPSPSGETQRFTDPALAVWRVGEPAPRVYDELYLNEGERKGFVHLDVETMLSGEPFVFDSAILEEAESGGDILSGGGGGGGDVIQEWGVVRASLRQRLVLPGVARLPGAFHSSWRTDVMVYNPLDEPQQVEVQFVPLGAEVQTAALRSVTLTLDPKEIRVIEDVLQSLFAIENGGGALHFLPATGINVTGRTYSRTGEGAGTFGYGMAAIDFLNAAGPHFYLTFSGAFPGANFRTNVILTDTSGRGTEARLTTLGRATTGYTAHSAPPNGTSQLNGVSGMLGLLSHEPAGLLIWPTRGTAIATVVAIDNRTNDPTYFPPDLPTSGVRTIPVVGHLDGAHGSRFRSDLYLLNLSGNYRTVTLELKRWDNDDPPRLAWIYLGPYQGRVIEDAVKYFGMQGFARLRYGVGDVAGDAGLRVTSRTYSVDANGGTYGCLVPPLNNFQSASPGEALEILGIAGGPGFRTNLGLVELSPNAWRFTTPVRILVMDEKGKVLDAFTVSLDAGRGMQINDIFAARGLKPPKAARIVVQVLGEFGLVGAYATLTDNVTNDSMYLGSNLAASPE